MAAQDMPKLLGLVAGQLSREENVGGQGERGQEGSYVTHIKDHPICKAGPRAPSFAPSLSWACCQRHLLDAAQLSLEGSVQNSPQLPSTFKIKC